MRTQIDCFDPGQCSDTLVVLLPPALASIDDFVAQGFVEAVRERGLCVDLQLADINGQHVLDRTVVALLHEHVLLPARCRGYQNVWLVGVSLGAYSALLCAAEHARSLQGLLAGLLLLSPYPGTQEVLAEIRAAAGPVAWSQHERDWLDERAWWRWLAQEGRHPSCSTAVYFATGAQDRFLRGQTLIADMLPPERVRLLPGGHDWSTWKQLWTQWLDQGPLRTLARPVAKGRGIQSDSKICIHEGRPYCDF